MSHSLPVTHRFSTRTKRARAHSRTHNRAYTKEKKRERERTRSASCFSPPRLFPFSSLLLPFPTSPPNPALSLLHAPLHSFFLVKPPHLSLSLSTFLIHLPSHLLLPLALVYTRKIVDGFDRFPVNFEPRSCCGRKSKKRASRVTPCLASCFRRRRAAFHARSALPVFPLAPPSSLAHPSTPHFHRFPFVSPLDLARYRDTYWKSFGRRCPRSAAKSAVVLPFSPLQRFFKGYIYVMINYSRIYYQVIFDLIVIIKIYY